MYQIYDNLPDLINLKVIHPGWWLGVIKKKRFEPAHAMALGLDCQQVLRFINLTYANPASKVSPVLSAYLRGEQLDLNHTNLELNGGKIIDEKSGWALLCLDYFPLGWVKLVQNSIKNYYPRGLRWI